ncbi:SAM-dependent methyltransferase [Streptomyces xiamenensis]|uniref:SAM-dependent methyltransferase n=1 Tax=Streptomyces xiamenensis TaxID=408015 RepID=UPI003D72A88C
MSEPDSTHQPPLIDTTVAHSARVTDALLGGTAHYEADREVAEHFRAEFPGVAESFVASRDFLGRAVRYLARDAGIRQFLDIGTGLPTENNTHEVAQRYQHDAAIVYVDNDPVVLLHSQALLTSTPEGTTTYIERDLSDVAGVLELAWRTLDRTQPVGLMLLGVLGHEPSADRAADLVAAYMDELTPGSYLVTCDTARSEESLAAQAAYAASGAVPYYVRTTKEIGAQARGLEILPPGVVSVTQWRPDPGMPVPPRVDQTGLVARKP